MASEPSDLARRVDHLLQIQGKDPEEERLLTAEITDYDRHQTDASGGTYLAVLADDSRAYHKRHDSLSSSTCRDYGHDTNTPPVHECAAWLFAKELGPRYRRLLPVTVYREIDGHFGSLAAELPGAKKASKNTLLTKVPDQVRDAGFFDVLVGQQDRNVTNYVLDEANGRLGLYDHSFCFPASSSGADRARNCKLQKIRRDELMQLQDDEIALIERVLKSGDLLSIAPLLEPARAAHMKARLTELLNPPRVIPQGK